MSTYKEVNAVTKSELSSGRLFLMNMVLILPVLTTVIQIFNSKESMSTIMKQLVVVMSPELSLWISNQEQWTLLELVLSVNSSDLTTLSSVKLVLVTTGPSVTTLKVQNLLTPYSMLLEKKLKDAIVFKVSKSLTHSVVEQDQVWVLF